MKRTFLSLIFCTVLVISNSYAALNPYAYGLSSQLSDDKTTLTVNYSLNAPATSVVWKLVADGSVVKTIDLSNIGLTKGDYTTKIPTTDFPGGKSLTWKVEVKGNSVDIPTQEATAYSLYCPHGLAIDKDPESEYFGRILVAEAMQAVPASGYVSSGKGAGLYVFNPDFTTDQKVHNGGLDFTRKLTSNGYQPYRVKISEDGRIFVSSLDLNGVVVWEVSKDLQTWTPVIAGTNNATDYNIYDAKGNFVAGLNCSMDVTGKGENLKLLLYSTNKDGIVFKQSGYRLDEYALGTATTWTGTPKNIINGGYGVVHTNVEWIYDGEGGYWFGASRGGHAGQPNLAHINAEGVEDYRDETNTYFGGDGVLLHKGMLIKGRQTTVDFITLGKDAYGKPTLKSKWNITADKIGLNKNEFAVDYADNLYVVGNSNEKIIAYALPYSGTVSTPCASKYAFIIGKYTMTVNTNDENKGTVSGGGEYLEGDVVTLTAMPKPGYKLLYWSDRSTENPRNITMTKNEALSAYFVKEYVVEPTFTIEKVWENTNVPASTNNGYQAVGWDGKIYMKDRLNATINVYTETGSELYAQLGSTVIGLAGDQPIAVDEAGNLIVRSGSSIFYDSPTQISIFRKDETTPKVIDFELPVTGRCDFISASGNIFSAEGGYIYFYCYEKTVINRLKITNGAATAADVTVDVVGDNITAGNTQNHVMVDIFGNLVAHSRSNGVNAINVLTNESKAFALPSIKMGTLGGCSFELGGKELWAYHAGATNYTSEWNIYNMTDGIFLSDTVFYAKNKTDKNSAANWLNVQVVDENTAYIYQFCPTVAVAVWKVTMHEVVLRDTANNEKLLNAWKDSTTNVFVYRSLTAGMYNTLCLPFNVNELTGTPLENATVWQYNGATVKGDGTSKEIFLDFTEVTSITAGEPYLVEPATDIAAPMMFKNVTISTTDGSNVAQNAVTMHGILHPTPLQANDKSILFLVENNNLAWANETANMNGMRAYFKVNDPSLLSARTRAYTRREPTVTTDMENITTTETEIKKVIYNNNLYILRGEEVYTIQGNRIK